MISLTPYDMTDETKIITTSPEQDRSKWRGKGVVASQTIFKQDFLSLLFFSLWSGKQIAWILLIRPSLRPAALVHFFVHPTTPAPSLPNGISVHLRFTCGETLKNYRKIKLKLISILFQIL